LTFVTLKKRSEFLRVRGGARWGTAAFLLEAKPRLGISQPDDREGARFGFTVTKKMGNAVVRNRIRRRLKAAIEHLAPDIAMAGYDYVLVSRRAAVSLPYQDLLSDLQQAFERVHNSLRHKRKKQRG